MDELFTCFQMCLAGGATTSTILTYCQVSMLEMHEKFTYCRVGSCGVSYFYEDGF